jgi:predicted NAD/FAD-binding protein
MNTATYPNFIKFLKQVRVSTVPTQMTFAVSRDSGKFEWSGDGKGLFAQRRNLFRRRHWRLIFDVIRFNQYALDILNDTSEASQSITIGQYLQQNGYSEAFRDDYLIPMTAAVWSTSPDKASLDFPAQTLIRFMWNHHLLSTIAARPDWMTIPGGSHQYIDAIVKDLGPRLRVHKGCQVTSIVRPVAGTQDTTALVFTKSNGQKAAESFDHVILACHGDEILPMLADEAQLQRIQSNSPCKFGCCNDEILHPHKGDSQVHLIPSHCTKPLS